MGARRSYNIFHHRVSGIHNYLHRYLLALGLFGNRNRNGYDQSCAYCEHHTGILYDLCRTISFAYR